MSVSIQYSQTGGSEKLARSLWCLWACFWAPGAWRRSLGGHCCSGGSPALQASLCALPREVVKITLVFVGLLLGSWRMTQEPWRPLLFSLAIVGLLLGFWRVAQEPWRPLLLFLAIVGLLLGSWRMAQEPWRLFRHQQDRPGLCCALFSRCASKLLFFHEDDESRSLVG